MNRRQLLLSALPLAAGLMPGCSSAPKKSALPGPPLPPDPRRPLSPSFASGPVPTSLPQGIRFSYSSCHVPGPFTAMTYDDGPHPSLTPRLLDMLAQWNLKATFFLIGKNAAAYPRIVQRIVAEGHEVANHSWDHPALSKLSDAAVRSQLRRTHDTIFQACGVASLCYRPPYGAITAAQKAWIAREFGYPTIMWSVDPNDWRDRNAGIVSSRIRAGARAGAIILAHDIHATTVAAMPSTLPPLQQRGLRFVSVASLITMEASGPNAGLAMATPSQPITSYAPGTY
ncbi:MAG: polysaccharide deacetylase [Verrucomicrobiales bacterium]|nr:polysaccharide deacetylase [Verrucomicrobiales bacterium]